MQRKYERMLVPPFNRNIGKTAKSERPLLLYYIGIPRNYIGSIWKLKDHIDTKWMLANQEI